MSKTKSNVHPGHYKVAGRERQGEEVVHDREKALLTQNRPGFEPEPPFTGWTTRKEQSRSEGEEIMPEEETLERARRDEEEGKSPSTQAGEFVREEIHHIREGKHGARSTKQAIAIGLSKARRAGVKLGVPRQGSKRVRQQAVRDSAKGRRNPRRQPSPKRSRAVTAALKREGRGAASRGALARQARSSARRRGSARRSVAARKAARTRARG